MFRYQICVFYSNLYIRSLDSKSDLTFVVQDVPTFYPFDEPWTAYVSFLFGLWIHLHQLFLDTPIKPVPTRKFVVHKDLFISVSY